MHIYFIVVSPDSWDQESLHMQKMYSHGCILYLFFCDLAVLGNLWVLSLFPFVVFSQMNKQNQTECTGWKKHKDPTLKVFCPFMSFHSLDMGRCMNLWLHYHFLIHINEYIARPKRNFQTSKLVLNHRTIDMLTLEKTSKIIKSNH